MYLKSMTLLVAVTFAGTLAQASAATLTFDKATFPGTGVPLTVAGSDGTIFTFSADSNSQFEAFPSGGGQYPSGTYFLIPGLGDEAPIDISFSKPLSSIAIPVAVSQSGNYTATVQFYDGSALVNTITKSGVTATPTTSSPPAPLFSYNQTVTSLVVTDTSTFSANFSGFPYNAAIGPVSYNVSAVPLPAAFPLFGAALLVIAGLGVVQTRKNNSVRNAA